MSRAKEIAAIMATYEPGQVWEIKYNKNSGGWQTHTGEPGWDWCSFDYRRKPEPPAPKYRPWAPEEGVGKVVRHKADQRWCSMVVAYNSMFKLASNVSIDPEGLLQNYTQLDGSPCGVLETPTTN